MTACSGRDSATQLIGLTARLNNGAAPPWLGLGDLRRSELAFRVLNRPTDKRDRAILMLFAIYGLRGSEVANLRLDDIDWEHDHLRINRAKMSWAE
jgi:integrase